MSRLFKNITSLVAVSFLVFLGAGSSESEKAKKGCRSGTPESIDDAKKYSNCAFEFKDDTFVAVGEPAQRIFVQFSPDLTYCYWEERQVTKDSPFFTRKIPLSIDIDKFIDTGENYLIFKCSEPDKWSADGMTLLSRSQRFTLHKFGISSSGYGSGKNVESKVLE